MLKFWIAYFITIIVFVFLISFDGGAEKSTCKFQDTCNCGIVLKIWYYIYFGMNFLFFLSRCVLYHKLVQKWAQRKIHKKYSRMIILYFQPLNFGVCVWGGFEFYKVYTDSFCSQAEFFRKNVVITKVMLFFVMVNATYITTVTILNLK